MSGGLKIKRNQNFFFNMNIKGEICMKTFDDMWEQIHNEQEWGKYPSEEIIRFVARNFYKRERANTKLLDAGCGSGAISWYLSREGFDVYAFDGSDTAIKKAKKRMCDEQLNVSFNVYDAANTEYEGDFFDGIIDSAMIYANTIQGIKAILKECHRILKPGGKLFSTGLFKVGMSGYGTGEKLEENTYREVTEGALAHRGTVHFFDEVQVNSYWKDTGYKNITIDSVDRTDCGGKVRVSYFMVTAEK